MFAHRSEKSGGFGHEEDEKAASKRIAAVGLNCDGRKKGQKP